MISRTTVAAVRVDGVHLGTKYLVVIVQGLPGRLDDGEELHVALYDGHDALPPLLLVVGDVPDHLEQGNDVLVVLH